MLRFTPFFTGYVRFTSTGGDAEGFINACMQKQLPVQNIRRTPLGFSAGIAAGKYKKLHKPARRYRCLLRIQRRYGIIFRLLKFRRRPGLLAGAVLAAVLLAIYPHMIWYIDFNACTKVQAQYLCQALFEQNIYEGCWHNETTLEYARRIIVVQSEEYSWLGLNFIDGRLTVEQVEKIKKPSIQATDFTDIVATQDGVISRIDLVGGYLTKLPGQSVAAGEVIVTGGHLNRVGNMMYLHSQANVYATVEKTYTYTQPLQYTACVPGITGSSRYTFYTLFGHKTVGSENTNTGTNVWQQQRLYPLRLWGLSLPCLVQEQSSRTADTIPAILTPAQATDIARMKIYEAATQDMGKYTIIAQKETTEETAENVKVTIKITAEAQIGKSVPHDATNNLAAGVTAPAQEINE